MAPLTDTSAAQSGWPLGVMIVCGYEQHSLSAQLDIVRRLGASHVEFYPRWQTAPDASEVSRQVRDAGFAVWSAHGPWGNETWDTGRVDLGSPESSMRRDSVRDVRRAIQWLSGAGGRCLVVHPGVLSVDADFDRRRGALRDSLAELAPTAAEHDVWLCVENLPRGSFPGSFTADNAALVRELAASHVGLCLDTGHANIMADVASEARAARELLRTTHVHDNDGQRDSHLLPGLGTVRWSDFPAVLSEIRYQGVVILECPRFLRDNPHLINDELRERLDVICRQPYVSS
jgi:sugar phosphate isomerase/epimerase